MAPQSHVGRRQEFSVSYRPISTFHANANLFFDASLIWFLSPLSQKPHYYSGDMVSTILRCSAGKGLERPNYRPTICNPGEQGNFAGVVRQSPKDFEHPVTRGHPTLWGFHPCLVVGSHMLGYP
jgi:hypothetical protein